MTKAKWGFIALAAGLLLLGLGGAAYAFHSGGVAECIGCHSMHSPAAGGTYLLVGSDPSSTCLTCHERPTGGSYRVSTSAATAIPQQLTPGGDFGWLRKSYSWNGRSAGSTEWEYGYTHGHNIVAKDFAYDADTTNAGKAPGGTFPSDQLACISCHDPHGRYRRMDTGNIVRGGVPGEATAPIIGSGSYDTSTEPSAGKAVGVYRLLAGVGYSVNKGLTPILFPGNPPAKVPATYNRSEASTQTRTAYGYSSTTGGHTSWGNWCSTCHAGMHSDGVGNYDHPTDEQLGADIALIYNKYVKSGDLTGSAASAFTSLVPFIENTNDYTTLASNAKNDNSKLQGPADQDRVSCLSCHRAHASGWMFAMRWNPEYEFLTKDSGVYCDPTVDADRFCARGKTQAETRQAYYDRPATAFAIYQRSLCNKCHAKD